MSVVDVVKLRRYKVLTNEGKHGVLVATKTLVGWVCQRQGPISINVAGNLQPSLHFQYILDNNGTGI